MMRQLSLTIVFLLACVMPGVYGATPSTTQPTTSQRIEAIQRQIAALPPGDPDRAALAQEVLRLKATLTKVTAPGTATPAVQPIAEKVSRDNAQAALYAHATQSDVDALRKQADDALAQQIDGLDNLVVRMPGHGQGTSTKAKLDALIAQRKELAQMPDSAIAAQINATRQEAANEAEAARQEQLAALAAEQARAVEVQQQRATILRAKFPNWDGPWKTCPLCNGLGEDLNAEREANDRTASIIAGQMVSGVRKAPMAYIPCDLCGGTGQVPDFANAR